MTPTHRDNERPLQLAEAWAQTWAQVPPGWREPRYRLAVAPYREVFTQNVKYHDRSEFDFSLPGDPRLSDEVAWWVHLCWDEGHRKIEPTSLTWWRDGAAALIVHRESLLQPVTSLAQLDPDAVVRESIRQFHQRKQRLPSQGTLRNLRSIAEHIHLFVGARTTVAPWWDAPVWSLRADNRIPRRAQEPAADTPVRLSTIEPVWLREGLRFYLSQTLIYDLYTWSTITARSREFRAYFGHYLMEQATFTPTLLTPLSPTLRTFMGGYLSWLRSPESTRNGKGLKPNGVSAVQSAVQSFYDFMYDHRDEAVEATGDQRWAELTHEHTRLWLPTQLAQGRRSAPTPDRFITSTDLARMAACIPLLAAPTDEEVTVDLPGGGQITSHGLGDPQAAHAWLLQAATGRRASEILMLDFNCLTPIPGPSTPDSKSTFVARMRYQQTKVAGIDPTILVEQHVVDLIARQQQWTRQHLELAPGQADPPYLFINPRHNHRGSRPRTYTSHSRILTRLNQITNLTDEHGNDLLFTSTHRLRHSRATALLNAGVPIHVVQDYLGHRSPEMTMHYARTLAKTAEAEFVKASASGAFGNPLEMDRTDLYQIVQMEGRTDRVLPNGLCLLPPTQVCNKGNACLTCSAFATDSSHLSELEGQRRQTLELIDSRQAAMEAKHGQSIPENNVWLQARRREVESLDLIIAALTGRQGPVKGAGRAARPAGQPDK